MDDSYEKLICPLSTAENESCLNYKFADVFDAHPADFQPCIECPFTQEELIQRL